MVVNWCIRIVKLIKSMTTKADGIKSDQDGACIRVDAMTGLVRIDGVPVFKARIASSGEIILQITDPNKFRVEGRGARYIEVSLSSLVSKIRIAGS